MSEDIASFPGAADPDNTFTETILNTLTSVTGVFHDVGDFGSIDLVITSNINFTNPTQSLALLIDWSDDGVTTRYTETLTCASPTGSAPAPYAMQPWPVTRPALLQFYRIRIRNYCNATVTVNVFSYLRPLAPWIPHLGYFRGSRIQSALLSNITIAGLATIVTTPLDPNLGILVVGYQLSIGAAGGNTLFFSDGTTQLIGAWRFSGGSFVAVGNTSEETYLFAAGPNKPLRVSASSTVAYDASIQYIYGVP